MDVKLGNIKSILIIRPDAIGDCMLITPAISLIREKYPNAKISVLCQSYTKDIFLHNPDVDELFEDWFVKKRASLTRGIRKYAEFIKGKNFDLSIHFYNELPYALLAKSAKIKYRVGDISKPLLRSFYNIKGDCRWNDLTLHEVEHNILLLKSLGIDLPESPPPMKIEANKEISKKIQEEHNLNNNDIVIGIHLGTGRGNKAWLPERYSQVIDSLSSKFKAKIIITGSEKEKIQAKKVLSLCKNKPIDLVGKTTLEELIATISRYNIYIGVDTGPLHIAAALKIPIVAIFPTKFVKPSEWGPWQTQHVIIRKAITCSQKCLPRNCPFDDCLKSISADDILAGVENILENKGNKTLIGMKADWFKKSVSIFTNRRDIQINLSIAGYHAVDIGMATSPIKLVKQMVKEDINVIHWVGLKFPGALHIAKFLATPQLPIPPIVIHEKSRNDLSVKSLIELYKLKFNTSLRH